MTEYMTEQEQVEQLKKWIKQYGLTIITGILFAVIIVYGWQAFKQYENRILFHASSTYDEMLALRAQNDAKGAIVQANKLLKHYSKTPYAQMAAFLLARDNVINKKYAEALNQLHWVTQHTNNKPIIEIAKIRIARILLEEQKPDEALAALKKVSDKSFNGLVEEVRGDAYLMLKDIPKAKGAYLASIKEFPSNESKARPILQMKLDNLASSGDITA